MVIPDSGFQGTWSSRRPYAQIFANTNPIWEVTPSVSYSFNSYCKLTAEVMLMFNEPESVDTDGNYVIAEMPGLARPRVRLCRSEHFGVLRSNRPDDVAVCLVDATM